MGGFSASSRPSATSNTKHVRFGKPAVESQALPNRYEKSYKSKKEKDALAAAQQTLLVPLPLTTKWYEAALPILQDTLVGPAATENMKPLERTRLRKEKVKPLEAKAAALYQDQIGLYQTEKAALSPADADWATQVMKNGTMTDKLSLLTLMVQEAPIYNLEALEKLVQMAGKKARREAIMAIDALKDLWTNNLAPTDRPLRYFHEQAIDVSSLTPLHSLSFYVEDRLKHLHGQFLQCLAQWAADTLAHIKVKIITVLRECLVAIPEGEKTALAILVNKLGDGDRKVASKIVTEMSEILRVHPAMKPFIVKEVLEVIWRPNVGDRAQYYALILLNQLVLTKKDTAIASALIGFYCDFFERQVSKAAVAQTGEKDAEANPKMLSAVLTGINRALPYSDLESDAFQTHLSSIFRVMHTSPLPTSLQALHLLYRLTSTSDELETRFFRALYAILHDPRLLDCAKMGLFFNILYRAMKEDLHPDRHAAFRKRILQGCATWDTDMTAGALVVLGEVPPTPVPPRQKDGPLYDAKKREPEFAGAQTEQCWELIPLQYHFHPTVSGRFVPALLRGEATEYKEDPTREFTLSRFLDRISYRGAKSTTATRGQSAMQAPSSRTAWGTIKAREDGPANERLPRQALKNVTPDEAYLWHYFDRSGRGTFGADGAAEKGDDITEKEEMDAIFRSGEDGLEPPEDDSDADDDDDSDQDSTDDDSDLSGFDDAEEEDEEEEVEQELESEDDLDDDAAFAKAMAESDEEEEEEEDELAEDESAVFATMDNLDLANAATFSDDDGDDDIEAEIEEETPAPSQKENSKRKRKRDHRSVLQKTMADMLDTDGMMDADAFERLMQQHGADSDNEDSDIAGDGAIEEEEEEEEEEDSEEDGDIPYALMSDDDDAVASVDEEERQPKKTLKKEKKRVSFQKPPKKMTKRK